jgi:integrase
LKFNFVTHRSNFTPDLFADQVAEGGSPESVLVEMSTWFEAWVAESNELKQLTRTASEEVYRAIWTSFTKWCVGRTPSVHLLTVTALDLQSYLTSRSGKTDPTARGTHGRAGKAEAADLSPIHQWRVLSLVDRVLAFAARRLDVEKNHAAANLIRSTEAVRLANVTTKGSPPEYLSPVDAKTLVIYLSEIRPRARDAGQLQRWQDLRDRASVGLQLGAGLTPGDVRAMKLAGVVIDGGRTKGVPWKLLVPPNGNTQARETPLAGWAGQLLRYWLQVRAELAVPTDWLFVATKSGKPWGKDSQYGCSRDVLETVFPGEHKSEGGSFRLRHTFALRQLKRGKDSHDVARWLGITDRAYMERYLNVIQTPVNVV